MSPTYAYHYRMVKRLKRRKVGDRKYEIILRSTGEVVAVSVMTGERGRDDYPWEVEMTHPGAPRIGSQPTLTQCIDNVAAQLLATC